MRAFRVLEKSSGLTIATIVAIASGSTSREPSKAASARSSAGGARSSSEMFREPASMPAGVYPLLGIALDGYGNLGNEVARNSNGHLVLAEGPERTLQLDAVPVDRLPELQLDRGRDVGGGDRAVHAALGASLGPQDDRGLHEVGRASCR